MKKLNFKTVVKIALVGLISLTMVGADFLPSMLDFSNDVVAGPSAGHARYRRTCNWNGNRTRHSRRSNGSISRTRIDRCTNGRLRRLEDRRIDSRGRRTRTTITTYRTNGNIQTVDRRDHRVSGSTRVGVVLARRVDRHENNWWNAVNRRVTTTRRNNGSRIRVVSRWYNANHETRVLSRTRDDRFNNRDVRTSRTEQTVGMLNAQRIARAYLAANQTLSRQNFIDHLVGVHRFSHADAVWASDNIGADWNAQAVRHARWRISITPFNLTRAELIHLLVSVQGFTQAQAEHAANTVGIH